MGFNKRLLKKENIINNINNLSNYLSKPDAIITTDEFSREVYRMFSNNVSEEEIINYIKNNK